MHALVDINILLDAFIDQAEDREHGELNFSGVYGGAVALRMRIRSLLEAAKARLRALPGDRAHRFVLDVMTLFYLSHPKVAAQGLEREARALLRTNLEAGTFTTEGSSAETHDRRAPLR